MDDFEIGNGAFERVWLKVSPIVPEHIVTVLIVLIADPDTVTRGSNMANLSNDFWKERCQSLEK